MLRWYHMYVPVGQQTTVVLQMKMHGWVLVSAMNVVHWLVAKPQKKREDQAVEFRPVPFAPLINALHWVRFRAKSVVELLPSCVWKDQRAWVAARILTIGRPCLKLNAAIVATSCLVNLTYDFVSAMAIVVTWMIQGSLWWDMSIHKRLGGKRGIYAYMDEWDENVVNTEIILFISKYVL